MNLIEKELPSLQSATDALRKSKDRYATLVNCGAHQPEVRTAECAVFGAEGLVELARARERGAIEKLLSLYRPFEVQVLQVVMPPPAGSVVQVCPPSKERLI